MKPTIIPLYVSLEAPLNDVVRIMQPQLTYKDITAIRRTGALQLTVPSHGLKGDWLGWVVGSEGMPELNGTVHKSPPHRLSVIDPHTLEINSLTAAGTLAKGGQLIYNKPVDFSEAVLFMAIYYKNQDLEWQLAVELSSDDEPYGLYIDAPGVIRRSIKAANANEMVKGEGYYTFDAKFPGDNITRYFEGPFHVSPV